MRTITTIDELMQVLEEHECNYYGLRGAHEDDLTYLDRGYLEPSHDWCDNEYTDEELDGTCAIGVSEYISKKEVERRYNEALKNYSPINTVLLIADSNQTYGNDDNEVILGHDGYGADVIAIVDIR